MVFSFTPTTIYGNNPLKKYVTVELVEIWKCEGGIMSDGFTKIEKAYAQISKVENVWEHPVVKCVMTLLDMVPGLGTVVDESVKLMLKDFQKKKLEDLFVYILEDPSITVENVSNITVLMEMARTIEAVSRLQCNDKIKYFANLMRNAIHGEETYTNTFDEWIERLKSMSYFEILLIVFFYKFEQDYEERVPKEEQQSYYRIETRWREFVSTASNEFSLSIAEIEARILSLCRLGLCNQIDVSYLGCSHKVYYTTIYFKKFYSEILECV